MLKPHELADALRTLLNAPSAQDCGIQGCGKNDCACDQAEAAQREARKVLETFDKEHHDYSDMLKGMPLVEALWWFIENVSEDDTSRNAYFFMLRERVRNEH